MSEITLKGYLINHLLEKLLYHVHINLYIICKINLS